MVPLRQGVMVKRIGLGLGVWALRGDYNVIVIMIDMKIIICQSKQF